MNSSLVFDKKELRSLIANFVSNGLDNGQVLPRYVEVSDVIFSVSTGQCAIDFVINYADIVRTNPSPQDDDELYGENPSDY